MPLKARIVVTPSGWPALTPPLCCLCYSDMDAAHHRHWPGVLKVIAGCHISLFQMPLPEDAVQLGGSMSLHGNHMTLACFHGPNFRSKSWALFHLEEPNIAFWTEAQKILEDGEGNKKTKKNKKASIFGNLSCINRDFSFCHIRLQRRFNLHCSDAGFPSRSQHHGYQTLRSPRKPHGHHHQNNAAAA